MESKESYAEQMINAIEELLSLVEEAEIVNSSFSVIHELAQQMLDELDSISED